MKHSTLYTIFIFYSALSFAQPNLQWQKCIGGTSFDKGWSIVQCIDSGYVVAGYTTSNDSDISGNHGDEDFLIVKTDVSGNIQWQKCFGGTGRDDAYQIIQTRDSGFIVGGASESVDGDVTGNHGGFNDIWVVKLNANGILQWQKCLGGTGGEDFYSIKQTPDGGYILAGSTSSSDGDVSSLIGQTDCWIVKLYSFGDIEWEKCYGGTKSETATSIQVTKDSGYVVCGYSKSNDVDLTVNNGEDDFWVFKINSLGTIEWQKSTGGSGSDFAYSLSQTPENGFIIAGTTNSNDSDVTNNNGVVDAWIEKLDSGGTILWQKCYGGSQYDDVYAIQTTSDSSFIFIGDSNSNDSIVSGNHGQFDVWIVKIDLMGNLVWQKCLGGSLDDVGYSIIETLENDLALTGFVRSDDFDVANNRGGGDCWITEMGGFVNIEEVDFSISNFIVYPNPTHGPASISLTIDRNTTLEINLYDITGRLVKNILPFSRIEKGKNLFTWDGSSNTIPQIENGFYFITVRTPENLISRSIVVEK